MQADATKMHVTSGFYPGEGAKNNPSQGQRGQPEDKEKQDGQELPEKQEAEKDRGGDLDFGQKGS